MFPASSKGGGADVTAGPLDACKTPSPGGPVPLPYANMVDGLAAGGDEAAKRTQKEIIEGAARKGYKADSATAAAVASQGDEAGRKGGLVSNKTMGRTTYTAGSSGMKAGGTLVAPSHGKAVIMGL